VPNKFKFGSAEVLSDGEVENNTGVSLSCSSSSERLSVSRSFMLKFLFNSELASGEGTKKRGFLVKLLPASPVSIC